MQQVPAVSGILPALRDSHLREIPSARKKINGLKLCKFKSGNDVCSVLPFSHFFLVFLPQAFVSMKLDSGQLLFSWVLGDTDLHAYTQKSSPTSLSLFAYWRYNFYFFSVAASEFQWTLQISHDRNDLLPNNSYANSKIQEIGRYLGTN